MADEDQRAARRADVTGGDRREAERGEGSNDSRHEQMDSYIRSEGIRFLEAAQSPGPLARNSAARTSPAQSGVLSQGALRDLAARPFPYSPAISGASSRRDDIPACARLALVDRSASHDARLGC